MLKIHTATGAEMTTNDTSSSPLRHEPEMEVPDGCVILSMAGSFVPWDNPDNLVSREVEQGVDEAVGVVFLPVLFLLSVSTNALSLAVFWRQGVGERINLCLFCLSGADLLYMLHSFLFNVDRLLHLPAGVSSQLGPVFFFLVKHRLVGFRGFIWVSGFLSMLIACERCFCVVSPLRSKTVLQTKTTAGVVGVSSLVILAGFFMVCTRWGVACVYDPHTNTTSDTIYNSQFYTENEEILNALDGVVYGLVLPGLYVTVVVATTVVTLYKLRRFADWREQTSSSSSASASSVSSRELALTRMLIGVSVLYVLCMVPTLVLGWCMLLVEEFSLTGRYYNAVNLLLSVFELFSYLNASVNFFVYCFLGSRYRETLKSLFRVKGLSQCQALSGASEREVKGKREG